MTGAEKAGLLKRLTDMDERMAFSKALDSAIRCHKQRVQAFSGFLDPFKVRKFVPMLVQNLHIQCMAFGGYDGCERQMIGMSPKGIPIAPADFPVAVVNVSYHGKFSRTLTHRDFLGAALGLGIERHCIGDIVLSDAFALIVVHIQMADYVCANLVSVGRTAVKASAQSWEAAAFPIPERETKRITVASLRLDSMVGAAFRLSRSSAAALVDKEKVFVNWSVCAAASKTLAPADMVTVRGHGRFEVGDIVGQTKKGRTMVEIQIST